MGMRQSPPFESNRLQNMTPRKSILGATLLLLACASTGALAQDRGGPDRGGPDRGGDRAAPSRGAAPAAAGDRGGRGGPGPNWGGPGRASGRVNFDRRYNHNHYYPSRGFVYGSLPYGALSVGFGGGNYFFHGGVWFRPSGGRYVVVQPPFGIFLPVLPPDYATVWVGSVPYYYADDVYYNAAPGQGYVVVAPPPGADTLQPAPAPVAAAPAAPDPIYYPRNNQGAAQTEADRRDCNTWATTQPNAMADSKVFQRAVDACMDGRSYTVR
jgi:hypothetical protein